MKQRSIILELDEAKQELVQCVNEILAKHRLSCYLIEPMFTELYAQVQASAQKELEQARANEEALAKSQSQVEKGAE